MRIGFLTNSGERVDGRLNDSRWLKVVTLCSDREAVDSFTVMLTNGLDMKLRIQQLKKEYKIDMLFSSGEGGYTKPLLIKEGIMHVPSPDSEPIRTLLARLMKRLSFLPASHPQRRFFEKTVQSRKQRCKLSFSTQTKTTLNQLTGDFV